jgi:hypothetical protein
MNVCSNYVLRSRERHSAIGLTHAKLSEVTRLAARCSRARNAYLRDYWSPCHAVSILTRSRLFADERRKIGWPHNGLSAHFNRVTLLSALAILKVSWRAALRHTEQAISNDQALSADERPWLRYVMRTPHLLQQCLDEKRISVEEPWAALLNEWRLGARLRRWILRHRGSLPRTASTWFDIDTNLYSVFEPVDDRHFQGAWIHLTAATKGRRLRIPLAGRGLLEFSPHTEKANSRPGLRVEVGDRIRFRLAARVPSAMPSGSAEAGVDLGYRTLLTVSKGDPDRAETYGN